MTAFTAKKTIWGVLLFLTVTQVSAQEIFISYSFDGSLYELDIQTCSYTQLAGSTFPEGDPTDITFHPNGKFYYITVNGNLKEYDYQNGIITEVYDFDLGASQNWNSLTADGSGIIYATGNDGDLWAYNLIDLAIFLGNIETPICPSVQPTGDLTFYKGDLYVAANCNGSDVIVKVNNDAPWDSEIVITSQLDNNIWGIVSHAENCNFQNVYAITGGDSEVYLIDFENQELTLVCELDFSVAGGATAFEYWASFPISIQNIEIMNPVCGENNGSVTIDVIGGVGQLSFSIDGVNFQNNNEFNDLAIGTYTITIIDENNCPIVYTIELEEDIQIIDIITSDELCESSNGSTSIIAIGGGGQLEYSINGSDFQSSNIFNNLSAGDYTVTVQDENNCTDETDIVIQGTEIPQIDNIISMDDECGNKSGSISITATGGAGQLKYSIDNINFQTNHTFNNLPRGNYTIIVKDENECRIEIDLELGGATKLNIINVNTNSTACGKNNGSISIEVEGGTGTIEASLNNSDFQSSLYFNDLEATSYVLTILDENGCVVDTSIVIIQDSCDVFIPNAFTPNDDGKNDLYNIYMSTDFKGKVNLIRIFSRWGELVFEKKNLADTTSINWDGTFRGKKLDVGIYVFLIEIQFENGRKKTFTGDVNLLN